MNLRDESFADTAHFGGKKLVLQSTYSQPVARTKTIQLIVYKTVCGCVHALLHAIDMDHGLGMGNLCLIGHVRLIGASCAASAGI